MSRTILIGLIQGSGAENSESRDATTVGSVLDDHTDLKRKKTGRFGEMVITDGQLLQRYFKNGDHSAFEQLVRAHGSMVLSVCQRILLNHHDAEEAFQATFLVFARKSSSLTSRGSVAGWLHETAQRTAMNARKARAQRRVREQTMVNIPDRATEPQDRWLEVAPLLDLELSSLPEIYRVSIVLCDLEGKSQQEAADQLGCSRGTLASRLVRGRELLQKRLSRLGVTVSIGAFVLLLSQRAASASAPAGLLTSTCEIVKLSTTGPAVTAGAISPHVAALAEGVLKAMYLSTVKNVIVALSLVVATGLGAGGLLYQLHAAEPSAKQKEMQQKFQGKWNVIKMETQGMELPEETLKSQKRCYKFEGSKWFQTVQGRHNGEGSMKIDTTKDPFEIDFHDITNPKGGAEADGMGTFSLDGDTLKIRMLLHRKGKDKDGKAVVRPTNLIKTDKNDTEENVLITMERAKP